MMATALSLPSQASPRQCGLVLEAFEAHFEGIYRYVRRSLDAREAEALTQQVFLRALSFKKLERKDLSAASLARIAEALLKRRARAASGAARRPARASAAPARARLRQAR